MFNVIEEPIDIHSLKFDYIPSQAIENLNTIEPQSIDVVVAFSDMPDERPFKYNPSVHEPCLIDFYHTLDRLGHVASKTSTLYVYGLPQWLPYFAVRLEENNWHFKYWVALETFHPELSTASMVHTHEGILVYVRSKNKFNLRKVRSPHQRCDVCGDFTADWGGKKHLRNPLGYAISDVWDDLPAVKDANHVLSREVWQRLVLMTAHNDNRVLCVAYNGVQDVDQFIVG